MLRGRLTCGLCQRRLQDQWGRGEASYRCRYPASTPTAARSEWPVDLDGPGRSGAQGTPRPVGFRAR
jgi:hypothetical protein